MNVQSYTNKRLILSTADRLRPGGDDLTDIHTRRSSTTVTSGRRRLSRFQLEQAGHDSSNRMQDDEHA